MNKPTEKDLQKEFWRSTYPRYEILAPNICLDWMSGEMDLLGLRKSGFVDEIEIKLTKADFKADFKKTIKVKEKGIIKYPYSKSYPVYEDKLKHDLIPLGKTYCNYYSFLMPEDLIGMCEIPDYAGVYAYYIDRAGNPRIRVMKSSPRLHSNKLPTRLQYEVGRKMGYRYWANI